MDVTFKNQLFKELEKANPEFLWQVLQFIQFLKQAERKVVPQQNPPVSPYARFIGCMTMDEGNNFAAAIENEFNQIEGEW